MTTVRKQEVKNFIRATYRSVWAIELLCILAEEPVRDWAPEELLATLRASALIVSQSTDALLAAGLIILNPDGSVRFQPVSKAAEDNARESLDLYESSPNAVRRLIVSAVNGGANAFAEAFKLRNE